MATEPETSEPDTPDAPGHDGDTGERLSRIETTLAEVISFLRGGGGQPEPAAEPQAPDIKREVREELAKLRSKEKADKDKAAEQQSIHDQLGKIQAALEQAPQEYRRVTQAMGWNKP